MKRFAITICLIFGIFGLVLVLVGCDGREEQPEPREEVEEVAIDVNEPRPADLENAIASDERVREPGEERMRRGLRELGEGRRPRRRLEVLLDANEVADPNELVAVNLTNIDVRGVIKQLQEWAEPKAIIPTTEEILKKKISVYAPEKLPRSQALLLVRAVLKANGIVATEEDGYILLKPIEEAKFGMVPTVTPEQLLAKIEDKSKIVQKFFKLESYLASQMMQIIQPLIGEYGFVTADDNSNKLIVIDSVANLQRIEKIIEQFDIPEAGQATEIEIFEIKYGDPAEIVQMLNQVLGTEGTTGTRTSRSRTSDRDRFRGPSFFRGPDRSSQSPASRSSSQQARPGSRTDSASRTSERGAATSVSIGVTRGPIILIPELKRRWIIARASAEDMKEIRRWIEKLDVEKEAAEQWETIILKYADADEVEDAIDDTLQDMSDRVGLMNAFIKALPQQKQVLIFGSEENRNMMKKLIVDIDVLPPPDRILPEETIPLKYLDPDETVEKLKEIYPVTAVSVIGRGYPSYRGRAPQAPEEEIYITSLPSQNAITVRAESQELLDQIVARIKEWDQPINWKEIEPRIIELRNTDPVQMTQMLNDWFGGEQGVSGQRIMRLFYGSESTGKINPLYGKVIFQEVPGTKKILVTSTILGVLDGIVAFVKKLDKAEPGEMPKPVQLKYADCEDLIERLNAIFNEPGTQARIRRSEVGILEQTIQVEEDGAQQQEQEAPGEYTPPWSGSGARGRVGEELPISNVIGKVRFIPDPRTKTIIVLAPSEYIEDIVQLINELDKPGKQVMIKAVVVEVDKSKLDSVGMQIASDPTAFGALGENSISALGQLTHQQSHGSMIFGAGGTSGNMNAVDLGMNITVLLDFLVKYTDAKVMNEQVLWTKDNETGEFFKGKEISLITQSSVSGQGIVTQGYERKKIGMTVRCKPNITPEKDVDMIMYLALSQLSQDLVNTQPVILETETKTNMIVKDGQTVLLASILTGEDSSIERKIPLLGDLPILGGLFRHNGALKLNSELLVFITPTVIDEESNLDEVPEIKEALEKKGSVEQHLDEVLDEWLEEGE